MVFLNWDSFIDWIPARHKHVNHEEGFQVVKILMGCDKSWHINSVSILFTILFLFSGVDGSKTEDPEFLDNLIRKHAMNALAKHRTVNLLKVSLPANFSGVEVSVVRIRSGSLWERGAANFSSFYIPSRVVPFPFARRIAIVYPNLGNWSSLYYQLPGYSFVTPVIGFLAYDATKLSRSSNQRLKLIVQGDPISVHLPDRFRSGGEGPDEPKCVKFGDGGLVQFRNITEGNRCLTESEGHFAVVVPLQGTKANRHLKHWVMGIIAGGIGLVLLIVILFTAFHLVRSKRIKDMEEGAERGVALDTIWIGRSIMPSASMIRTQPSLEHGYTS